MIQKISRKYMPISMLLIRNTERNRYDKGEMSSLIMNRTETKSIVSQKNEV